MAALIRAIATILTRPAPSGLVTNEIGWRGPPLRPLTKRTVRIVFVGASTTADTHGFPWSYPELIDHWLALWAKSKNLNVDFQALNAAREAIWSTDNAAIVRNEVVPMQPDLVVYYEGARSVLLDVAGAEYAAGGAAAEHTRGDDGTVLSAGTCALFCSCAACSGRIRRGCR